jgi:hypothetical protein
MSQPPFTVPLNIDCGIYKTDAEEFLHHELIKHHNARIGLIAEVKSLRAEIDNLRSLLFGAADPEPSRPYVPPMGEQR